jgi:acyl-CoA thioesterase-1
MRQCGLGSGALRALLGISVLLASFAVAHAQTSVVAFGTSFTHGKGVSSTDSYPSQLERLLRAKGSNVTVQNAGWDGDSAAGGLSRLDSAVPSGTQVAIVEFGVNEFCAFCSSIKYTPGDRAQVIANLRQIVDRLNARGIKVILISLRGVPVAKAASGGARTVSFPELASSQYSLGDSQGHVNPAGYAMVAAKLAPMVQSLLGKAKS